MNSLTTKKRFRRMRIFGAVFFAMCFLFVSPQVASAEEGGIAGDIPQENATYTLTYPDGTVVTENEDGTPLTYEDVLRLQQTENWKLLGSGFTTDKNGEAELPAEWSEGTVRIVETKVPAGYTKGDETEKIVELADGETTFVNPKEKTPDPATPESKTPTGKTATSTPATATAPKTGDTQQMLLFLAVCVAAALALAALAAARRRRRS